MRERKAGHSCGSDVLGPNAACACGLWSYVHTATALLIRRASGRDAQTAQDAAQSKFLLTSTISNHAALMQSLAWALSYKSWALTLLEGYPRKDTHSVTYNVSVRILARETAGFTLHQSAINRDQYWLHRQTRQAQTRGPVIQLRATHICVRCTQYGGFYAIAVPVKLKPGKLSRSRMQRSIIH
jgi:hypothetical protein